MILSFFITVIPDHDKPQPPGCLLDTELKARQAALDKALRDATDAREAKATLTGELQSLKTHNDQLAALLAGKK
ncbi:hypothetical protein QDX30_25250 (plasmid) [Escherichia coli]|uniref:hypothetical protein n=1 Tax=Escherichia coli TaxID=562 RepID=UPI0024ADCEF0|nr:hypothetical protein [Escherichia coli]WHH39638.1 hypothetical protein QDX30_25250 [Escherichia coli]